MFDWIESLFTGKEVYWSVLDLNAPLSSGGYKFVYHVPVKLPQAVIEFLVGKEKTLDNGAKVQVNTIVYNEATGDYEVYATTKQATDPLAQQAGTGTYFAIGLVAIVGMSLLNMTLVRVEKLVDKTVVQVSAFIVLVVVIWAFWKFGLKKG